jgi:hypothetical protein
MVSLQNRKFLSSSNIRFREDEIPPNPPKIDFELVKKVLPKEFQVHEINSKKPGRALVFFTEHQMELLKRAKRWFLDGTFRIVKSLGPR